VRVRCLEVLRVGEGLFVKFCWLDEGLVGQCGADCSRLEKTGKGVNWGKVYWNLDGRGKLDPALATGKQEGLSQSFSLTLTVRTLTLDMPTLSTTVELIHVVQFLSIRQCPPSAPVEAGSHSISISTSHPWRQESTSLLGPRRSSFGTSTAFWVQYGCIFSATYLLRPTPSTSNRSSPA